MSERINALAQLLTGKPAEASSLEEIQLLANKYPYFSAAQFLLLQKLKSTDQEGYNAALQKSLLHYHDPLQFQYFISSATVFSGIDPTSDAGTPTLEEDEHTLYSTHPDQETTEAEQESLEPEKQPDPETYNGEQAADVQVVEAKQISDSAEKASPHEEIPHEEIMVQASSEEDAPRTITGDAGEDQRDPADSSPQLGSIRLNLDPTPAPADTDLVFEPFHTVDYFASQGIKDLQDEKPKDKFGQQLRSFTDWLKMMKKLPAADAAKSVDASAEKKVEHLAAHSIDEPNVITEAMAEVWLKQGNREKAIETYNKLSLLNPSKKAFFAAKIQHLKTL